MFLNIRKYRIGSGYYRDIASVFIPIALFVFLGVVLFIEIATIPVANAQRTMSPTEKAVIRIAKAEEGQANELYKIRKILEKATR